MLPARKFPLGERLIWLLIKSSLRKHFDRIFFRMQGELTAEQRHLPIIICANHSSWWDGYVAALVERHLELDGYLMMEEPQLRRYFFFRWIGCFSVNRSDGRSAMKTLHYATHLLKARTNRMVWIFPQGEIAPNDRRPLVFSTGATHLAKMSSPSLLFPCAIRIEYLAEQRPDLYISLGSPIVVNKEEVQSPGMLKQLARRLEEQVTMELEQLHSDVTASNYTGFTQLLHGQASINRRFDAAMLRRQISRQ